MPNTTLTAISLIALLALPDASLWARDVYKWRDTRGRAHYSDIPPSDGNASVLRLKSSKGVLRPRAADPQTAESDPAVPTGLDTQSLPDRSDPAHRMTPSATPSGDAGWSAAPGGGGASAGTGGTAGNQAAATPETIGAASETVAPRSSESQAPQEREPEPPTITAQFAFPGPARGPIPRTFFGLHIHRADTTTPWPSVPFGSWRLWDANVTWSRVEPMKGQWNWSRLDRYVQLARENGVELVFTLGATPAWASARPGEKGPYGPGTAAEPAKLSDWEDYVRAVVTRYRGQIAYYEIWNEPNLSGRQSGPGYYSGSAENLVALTRAAQRVIKSLDPQAKVVSPPPVAEVVRIEPFFRLGGGAYPDIVGAHFYGIPPETLVQAVGSLRQMMDRYRLGDAPLWNTESGFLRGEQPSRFRLKPGGVFSNRLSDDELAALLVRHIALAASLGLDRYFYYSWDNDEMGLADGSGRRPNEAAIAFAQAYRWLVGATISPCSTSGAGLWACELRRGSRRAWLVWVTGQPVRLTLPPDFGAVAFEAIDLKRVMLGSPDAVLVTQRPILIRADFGEWD